MLGGLHVEDELLLCNGSECFSTHIKLHANFMLLAPSIFLEYVAYKGYRGIESDATCFI